MMLIDRYMGSILGLAIGDALGAPVEFQSPGTFTPVTGMLQGGAFGLPAGYWTDDTSLALCLAESLIDTKGFNLVDQLERYDRWYRYGHLSSTGICFDIGNTTRMALEKFERSGDPYSGPTGPGTEGNGSLMRLAPVPLAYASSFSEAVAKSGESSRTTHGAIEAVDCCRLMGSLLHGVISGQDKEDILSGRYGGEQGYWNNNPLAPRVEEIAKGSYKSKMPPQVRGSGYVVESLEAALWAFFNADSFASGCLLAVNLGDDADTTAAVYGQLAGAYYGVNAIPEDWLSGLAHRELLEGFARGLYEFAKGSDDPNG